ncbi:MAG: hypothetical protein Q9195_004993 [Heterodermia aff. obscurata]
MRFTLFPFIRTSIIATSALAAVLPTEKLPLSKRDDACNSGSLAPIEWVGGNGGTYFCENRLQSTGEVLSGLEVWSDDGGIFGIQLTFSSGTSVTYGNQGNGRTDNLNLAAGELVESARLWGNGKGQHLGHIYIKTDKQEFDVGMPKPNDGYAANIGGGLLMGAFGYTGDKYLTSIAFLYLGAKIDHIEIGSVQFDPDPTGTSTNIAPVYIIDSTFGNPRNSTGPVPFTVAGAETVTTSTTWTQSTTGKFGMSMSVEVEAEPFGIGAKITGGFEWSVEHTTSTATTKTDTITVTNTAGPMVLQPGHGQECKIFAQRGEGNFPYTSTVSLKLVDGSEVSYQEKGELQTVQYTEAKASCVDANQPIKWEGTLQNPPKGVTTG